MKTSKRLLALVLCVLALCTSLVIVHAAEERGIHITCVECGIGELHESTSIKNQHTECRSCSHGLGTSAADVYDCYTIVTTTSCSNCSYSYSTSEYCEDFLFCAGASNR